MEQMISELAAGIAQPATLTPTQIGALRPQDSDEDLLGGAAAKKERDIIESNRVKLANYIHDVTTLFPLLRQEGVFSRDDVEIIEAPVTTTAKVDKCLDVLLRKGPRAIGVFHEALSFQYRHLFNYLAQLFTQAGLSLPPSRQMKDEEDDLGKEVNPLDIRHSRSNSTYRSGSRSVTIRKRLEIMSRQCEIMEKEKTGLQKALSDREGEISSLLSAKEHVQTSLNNVQGRYQELLSQLTHWRSALESDSAVQQWMVERENIQREYDQIEQDYNLQCSELNAARERISLLLQQLERSEKIVAYTQETCQKDRDMYKHRISVLEGEVKRLLEKLDYIITTPTSSEARANGECPEVRCEKLQHELEQARDQISTLKAHQEVLQRERMQAYDERDLMIQKQYSENVKRKAVEKEVKQLKIQIDTISTSSDHLHSPQTPHKALGGTSSVSMPYALPPTRHASCPGEDMMVLRPGGRGTLVKVENLEVFMPAPRVDVDLGMKLELGVVVRELKEGSLPHKHGLRIGDEICRVNKFTLYGENPLDFFNSLLKNATEPVALTLRRQVQVVDTGRPYNTLPVSTASPQSNRPLSPCFPAFHPPSSSIFPLNPQLGAATLSRKSPAFQSPPTTGAAGSPVSGSTTMMDTSLEGGKASTAQQRVSTDGTSNSTLSTNKDFTSSSSSDEDGAERPGHRKRRPRTPVIIPQQKSHNRFSTASDQSGIVTSPTEQRSSAWKENRLTRISTIDSGFEFPFTDDGQPVEPVVDLLQSSEWDVVESPEVVDELRREEEEGRGEGDKGFRDRRGAVAKDRTSGPRRKKGVYHKKPHVSKSLDDLSERRKPAPVRRDSRNGERTVTITKQEFLSEIKLIGGRGYGMFIETDSRRHTVETGDKILEIGDKSVGRLTRAEVFELLDLSFMKNDSVQMTVFYDAKSLSQLPPHAKDNFYVRCIQFYRPTHSILTKNYDLPFEKGDVLHITNTLPTGHTGYWQAEKVGSKGEIQGSGLVPISLNSDSGDDKIKNGSPKTAPKYGNKTHSMDICLSSSLSFAKALHIYRPVCRVTVQYPRPVLLLGVLQKDFRKHIVSQSTATQDDVKFCFPIPEEASKVSCSEDEIVERLQVEGKTMITTTSHIKDLAREGYHCVLCSDADSLHFQGLQSLTPIVLYLYTSAVRVVNKIRQRLSHDGEFSAQEEIDYTEGLRRYRQYFTGQIDLQVSMDVVKEIRTTVARQQKSVIWENET